jgi:hypothetical protein
MQVNYFNIEEDAVPSLALVYHTAPPGANNIPMAVDAIMGVPTFSSANATSHDKDAFLLRLDLNWVIRVL